MANDEYFARRLATSGCAASSLAERSAARRRVVRIVAGERLKSDELLRDG